MPGDKQAELDKSEKRFDELNNSITKEEKQLDRERIIGEPTDKKAPAEIQRSPDRVC